MFTNVSDQMCARIAQTVQRPATGWKVWGSNPSGIEIFRTRPERPWDPPNFLYNGHQLSCLGINRPGRGVNHPLPSIGDVKERVELYLYFPLELYGLYLDRLYFTSDQIEQGSVSSILKMVTKSVPQRLG
jgi:hypothetical protein